MFVVGIYFCFVFFFFNDTATTEIYTLSLHDALPIYKANTIFLGAGHGLHTGDKVKYQKSDDGGSLAIGGLTDDTEYWVIEAGNGKIKLATSEDNAHAGTAIDLLAPAPADVLGEDHKFERSGLFGTGFFAGDDIVFDPATAHRLVDLGKGSVLHTGDAVTYKSAAGAADDIGGLTDETKYYVIRYDDNTAELAATREDALAGKSIGLTSPGTGTAHKLAESASVFRAEARSDRKSTRLNSSHQLRWY